MTHHYFAYGANTNLNKMAERCPRAICLGRAWIDGYGFRWRKWADIEISRDEYTVGVLWQLDDDELAKLDAFEHYPHHYFRQRVIIEQSQGPVTGWAYMMTVQDFEEGPSDAYRNMLFNGYSQNELADTQLTDSLLRVKSK